MIFGKIYDYRNKEEAKKLIGKKVLASDCLCNMEKTKGSVRMLLEVSEKDNAHPFLVDIEMMKQIRYQFIREIEEEPKLMTNRQLAEWLARGFGERKLREDDPVGNALIYYEDDENLPVGEDMVIRHWGSDEWVKPTFDIYERDCRGIGE